MRDLTTEFYSALDWRYAQGDRDGVERLLLEYSRPADGEERIEEQIAALNELGAFYRGAGRYTQSLDAFERARALTAGQLGETCVQYATILNNMAGTHRLMGNCEDAVGLFCKALDVYRDAGETDSYAYVSVLNNLSLASRRRSTVWNGQGSGSSGSRTAHRSWPSPTTT